MKLSGTLLLAALIFVQPALSASAEGVFTWEDESGVLHFSSSKDTEKAQLADLPPIMRGEVKLAPVPLVSCKEHGGIDCQAGSDSDGSVICLDGFKNATARFRFSCNSPRLKVVELIDEEEGLPPKVLVRNSNSVPAKTPVISYRAESGEELSFSGPAEIAPYGVGEFVLNTHVEQSENAELPEGAEQTEETKEFDNIVQSVPERLKLARITITCENCSQ